MNGAAGSSAATGRSAPAGGVILAAGAATRFGGPKLAALRRGRPVIGDVVDAAKQAGLAPVVVVVGHHRETVVGVLDPSDDVLLVVNEEVAEGLASSLRCGLAALARLPDPPQAAVLLLGDEPDVRSSTIRKVVEVAATGVIARARYEDGDGHPVGVPRSQWGRVLGAVRGDRGLGPLLPRLKVTAVLIAGRRPLDIDRPDDLVEVAGAPDD